MEYFKNWFLKLFNLKNNEKKTIIMKLNVTEKRLTKIKQKKGFETIKFILKWAIIAGAIWLSKDNIRQKF